MVCGRGLQELGMDQALLQTPARDATHLLRETLLRAFLYNLDLETHEQPEHTHA